MYNLWRRSMNVLIIIIRILDLGVRVGNCSSDHCRADRTTSEHVVDLAQQGYRVGISTTGPRRYILLK